MATVNSPPPPSSSSSSFYSSIVSLLLYLYVLFRRHLTTIWIKINRSISQSNRLISSSNAHKVVIIGDGFAFGLGDSIIAGGLAGIVPYIQSASTLESAIRRNWMVINKGEVYGTTSLWLPPDASTDRGGKLWEATFGSNGCCQSVEIVVLLMGTLDVLRDEDGLPAEATKRDMMDMPYPESELSDIAKRILRIAAALQLQRKRVCVVDLPTTGVPGVGRGKLRRLNQQIKQCVKQRNSETKSCYPIKYVALGNNHKVMRSEYRAFDSLHLNHNGYKCLAKDLFLDGGVKDCMVNVEWEIWKGLLREEGELDVHEEAMREGEMNGTKKEQ